MNVWHRHLLVGKYVLTQKVVLSALVTTGMNWMMISVLALVS